MSENPNVYPHIATFIKKPHTDAVLPVYILYVAQMYNTFLLLFFAIIQQIKCTFICSFYWSICLSVLTSLHNSWNAIIKILSNQFCTLSTPRFHISNQLWKNQSEKPHVLAPLMLVIFSWMYTTHYIEKIANVHPIFWKMKHFLQQPKTDFSLFYNCK